MRNWAGNQAFRSRRVLRAGVGRRAGRDRPWFRVDPGARHSALVQSAGRHDGRPCLARSPGCSDRAWIRTAGTVTVGGGQRYGELCQFLESAGFALANLASLPHISIAGSCATASHGSGVRNANLAAAAAAVEIVRADGEIERIDRADARRRPAWGGRLARCARRRQQRDARHRADIPDAPGRRTKTSRCPSSSTISTRSSRRPTASASSPTGAGRRSTRCG